ncbi:unnamed protein product [Dibothriocephalus latus]|uniref:Uncharacterized protein n=1 Tax=Dibothriocephalus latus TaxID=60516 RepID=A0A3P7LJD0_DIBLA|nr:unnamed protein product [Dibothriocephalus latus]
MYNPFFLSLKDEQVIAADLSAKINEAYKILVDPISRAEYILSLQGSPATEKETEPVDKEFLLEVMELGEKLEELALIAKSDAPNEDIVKELEDICAHIIQRRTEEMNLLAEYIKCSRWELKRLSTGYLFVCRSTVSASDDEVKIETVLP